MRLCKFKPLFIFFLFFSSSSWSYTAFTDNECLDQSFDTKVSHSLDPFGLIKINLLMTKKLCVVKIVKERFKFFKKEWEIDVCRGPVHMKASDSVVKKSEEECEVEGKVGSYCNQKQTLLSTLQDDGLIFAEGEKEDLATEHGQLYCGFLLVKKYLSEGFVFNRHIKYDGLIVPVATNKQPKEIEKPKVEKKNEDLKEKLEEENDRLSEDGPQIREL